MDYPTQSETNSIENTIQALASTVAHLALQLTVSQIQLRALGTVLAERGIVDANAVLATTAALAEQYAPGFLRENLGADLTELVNLEDLERQIIDYLRFREDA